MSSLTPPAVPTASRRVVIEGLEKAENANHVTVDEKSSTSTLSITMHEDEPLSDVWNRIKGCPSSVLTCKHYIDTKQTAALRNLTY
jgi:hypothetical protein